MISTTRLILLFTVLICFCFLLSSGAYWDSGDESIKAVRAKKRKGERIRLKDIKDNLQLNGADNELRRVVAQRGKKGKKIKKYQQVYCNLPVYDAQLTITTVNRAVNGSIVDDITTARGDLLGNMEAEMPCTKVRARIGTEKAQQIVKRYLKKKHPEKYKGKQVEWFFSTEKYIMAYERPKRHRRRWKKHERPNRLMGENNKKGKRNRQARERKNNRKLKNQNNPKKGRRVKRRVKKNNRKTRKQKQKTIPVIMYLVRVSVYNKKNSLPDKENETDAYVFKIHSVDRSNGSIIEYWEDKQNIAVSLTGGNLKTKYTRTFDVEELGGGQCRLKNADVQVYHGQNSYNLNAAPNPYQFTCSQGLNDFVNGGHSPLADAYFFGTKIIQLITRELNGYKSPARPVNIVTHFGSNYLNAMYVPAYKRIYLGDGDGFNFFPLTTAAIIAHEVGHAFTSVDGGRMEYKNESGGVNEAFSDIMAIALDKEIFNISDFEVGDDAAKVDGMFLRNMCDQSVDGKSAIHVDQLKDGMDPHYASGVINRVACLIAKSAGFDVASTFKLFLWTNRYFMTPSETFWKLACELIYMADWLGMDYISVKKALMEVGIVTVDNEGQLCT